MKYVKGTAGISGLVSDQPEQIMEEEERQTSGAIIGKQQSVYVRDFNLKDAADRLMNSNQTGRFPVTSFKGTNT